jgi:hypothetical protein
MFSTLRTRFGIPGVISVMALVFAMFGGAYAASNSSGGGKATASAKAKKGPRGPKGPKGDKGDAGPAGPAGAKGDAGANGTNGTSGTSATTESFSGEAHGCKAGGVAVKSASPEAFVCNGKNGTNGTTGFTETLPSEKTETGIWAINGSGGAAAATVGLETIPISFPIPLASTPTATFLSEAEPSAPGCPGVIGGLPTAEPGNLCVYANALEGVENEGFSHAATGAECGSFGCFKPGATPMGTLLSLNVEFTFSYAGGAWAVTAE